MLPPRDKNGFQVIASSAGVKVETCFAEFNVRQQTAANGQTETWGRLITRPAFEVALLAKEDGETKVLLMQKQRLAGEPPVTKCPGGYIFLKGSELNLDNFLSKILGGGFGSVDLYDVLPFGSFIEERMLSLGICTNFTNMQLFGCVVGHGEIITPILLLATNKWQQVAPPPEGISFRKMLLSEAARLAVQTVQIGRRMKDALDSDSSVELLLSLYAKEQLR